MPKFTKIPTTTFQKIQLNAGILLSEFTPSTGTFVDTNIIGATSGGNTFEAVPSFTDFGEDIDNCPKNTKELKHVDQWDAKLSGTFVTVDTTLAKKLAAASDIDGTDTTKIVPRADLASTDFSDIWLVCDYSNINTETNGGFIAIKLINALNTGGFKLTTVDKNKGKFAFEFEGHYSISSPETVPFEMYVKAGAQG